MPRLNMQQQQQQSHCCVTERPVLTSHKAVETCMHPSASALSNTFRGLITRQMIAVSRSRPGQHKQQAVCTAGQGHTITKQTSLDARVVHLALRLYAAGLLCGCDVPNGCTIQ